MPSYIANPTPTQVNALYRGDRIACVNDASTDSGVTKTLQFAVAPEPGAGGVTIVPVNSTDQQATGQWAAEDVDAEYQDLSGCVVAAGSAFPYNLSGGWMRFTFAVAPTSGSLIVSR